jgi:prolyl-tRNA editing enzyme YbaK/EbsC (Cys-tRNA(Pro) deacylase)
MDDELKRSMVVLMDGEYKVSTKELARQVGCKKVEPCTPDVANRHTGFLMGGTSPFGTKKDAYIFRAQHFGFATDLYK